MRPEGIKAAKASRNSGKGKAYGDYKSMWDLKMEDLAQKEKLSKLAILDTLLAKKEPLSESEEVVKNKLLALGTRRSSPDLKSRSIISRSRDRSIVRPKASPPIRIRKEIIAIASCAFLDWPMNFDESL
ncbi:hypothetical protein DY000_02045382 [Brassica cretica]|uniref:Uncharacterized protein n=1 Tax=Brassica cretica TaxID=69181 RepID=A0ABQ7EPY2_BRACR|nr:hypothetical protein DY000_02045382 [Brassica cretica]